VAGADESSDNAELQSSGDAELAVRTMTRDGTFARYMAAAPAQQFRLLRAAAYDIVWPVVFQRSTRRLELARGHRACASSIVRLEPACHDRFIDDVEAVLDHLIQKATKPIVKLEGWITGSIASASVDAHRRRRGERGALQRPRLPLPRWLAEALHHDPWLQALVIEMLVWVGVPTTAGTGLWPLGAWVERRAAATGDFATTELDVAEDVRTVLVAMRRKPAWYADYVERPLGCKEVPVLPAQRTDPDPIREPEYLALSPRDETDGRRLAALAAAAMDRIEARFAHGEDLRTVVVDVLGTAFGAGTGVEDMDRVPGPARGETDRVRELLADPERIDQIVATFLRILGERAAMSGT